MICAESPQLVCAPRAECSALSWSFTLIEMELYMRPQLLVAAIAVGLAACGDNQISSPTSAASVARGTRAIAVGDRAPAAKPQPAPFTITYVDGATVAINRSSIVWDGFATCPAGSKVIGGGYKYPNGGFSNGDFIPQISQPDPVKNQWMVQIYFGSNGGETALNLQVYAVCIQ